MKKILFATSALAAAGLGTSAATAAEWDTFVNGYYYLGVGLTDSNNQDGIGVLRDGEFHVNARLTADNGITFRARVEVESFTSSDQIDENWGRIEGSFGAFMIGSNDSVGYENSVGVIYAPGARIGYADSFCLTSACSTAGFSPFPGVSGDFLGLHYSSPDFMGFQLHGTYQPNRSSDGAGDSNNPIFGDSLVDTGRFDTEFYNIAASYNGDFGDFGFGLSGEWADISNTNSSLWNIAARVDFSGFSLAGFYQDNFGSDEFGIGGQYATGPWTIAGGYSYAEGGGTVGGGDGDFVSGWVTYAVAPGVLVTGGVEWADADGDGVGGDFGGLGFLTLRF